MRLTQARAIVDLSPSWSIDDWSVVCSTCPYRADSLAFVELPSHFWSFDVGELRVWAWNRDHLVFIAKYLNGEPVKGDPYSWLGTYIPGAWKHRADQVVQAINQRLLVPAPSL